MSPVHSSNDRPLRLTKWRNLTLVLIPFKLIYLQMSVWLFRIATGTSRRDVFLVDRQEWPKADLLGRTKQQQTHLFVRINRNLHSQRAALQLRFHVSKSTHGSRQISLTLIFLQKITIQFHQSNNRLHHKQRNSSRGQREFRKHQHRQSALGR